MGPLAASEDCAKNKNVAVRMSNIEITTRCRLAMLNSIDDQNAFGTCMLEAAPEACLEYALVWRIIFAPMNVSFHLRKPTICM